MDRKYIILIILIAIIALIGGYFLLNGQTQPSEKTTLIRSNHNGGYGSGNNLGVRYAHDSLKSTHVLIANPDAVFDEDLVRNLPELWRTGSPERE